MSPKRNLLTRGRFPRHYATPRSMPLFLRARPDVDPEHAGASGTAAVHLLGRLALVVGAVGLAMALTSGRSDGRADASSAPGCVPAGAPVLLSNSMAAIYREKLGGISGCAVNGTDYNLGIAELAYKPPIMALSGEMTAIVDDSDEAGIQIRTLALRPGAEATPIGRPEERIGSIRVRPDGTVAWIACPLGPDADPDKIIISPKPECVRPRRARNRVLLFRPAQGFRDERLRQLSAASRIDPASLKMNATTVSWMRDGRRVRHRYR